MGLEGFESRVNVAVPEEDVPGRRKHWTQLVGRVHKPGSLSLYSTGASGGRKCAAARSLDGSNKWSSLPGSLGLFFCNFWGVGGGVREERTRHARVFS